MRRSDLLIALFGLMLIPILSRAETPQHAPGSSPSVNLLAMGDWGRNDASQKRVADAMAGYVTDCRVKFDGILLAGDNVYAKKLTGTSDPLWQTMFEQMYDPSVIDFPFYVSLGNHDYENGKHVIERAYARENPQSRWKMPSRYYRLDLPKENPLVTVLMLDSNRPLMGPAEWSAELYWIKTELAKPRTTKWLIACAHHPFYSNGDHGDNSVLRKAWEPLFTEAKMDMYICGHDHDLQHLEIPNLLTSLILVGGGGAGVRPMRNDTRGPFSKSEYGFAAMNFTGDSMTVKLVSKDQEVIHAFRRTPDRHVEILETTPSDPAKPRTVKSITRSDENAATKPALSPATKEKDDD